MFRNVLNMFPFKIIYECGSEHYQRVHVPDRSPHYKYSSLFTKEPTWGHHLRCVVLRKYYAYYMIIQDSNILKLFSKHLSTYF